VPPRKERIAVVFDTNIVIATYLGKNPKSAVRKIFALWRIQRKLQLIVSNETVAEYLEILARLNVPSKRINAFAERIVKSV
jgi:predicted nucleic acid-binding protein